MQHNCTGTGVALVTPFFESGEVDLASLELLLEHVRAKGKGVDYMVVCDGSSLARQNTGHEQDPIG